MFRQSMYLASLVLALACAWTAQGTVDLNTGLAAWWSFDEGAGTTAFDGSGNNNHATLMGGATWTTPGAPGREEGYAISLNGTSAYLRIEHSPSLNLSDALTFEMWVYGGGTPAKQIISKGNSGDGTTWWQPLGIRIDNDPPYYRQINWRNRFGETVNALNSRTAIPPAEWTHIAVTFDVAAPGNNQKIYMNGKLDAESRSTAALVTNTGPVFIGADAYAAAGRWWWQGMIDEGSIYSRALNAVEIKTIAGVTASTDPAPKDGAIVSTTDVLLQWYQGSNVAASQGHHLYFSDQFEDVNTAATGADKGLMTDPNYAVAGLTPGTTYFWRVDEVNDVHPDKIWKGPVWSFTVASGKAADPSPPDGALYVGRNRILSWAPGIGAVSHRVYFGIDQNKVSAGAADVDKGAVTDPNYTPGTLKHDTTYYWRVDEFDGTTTHPGDVWALQTTASGDPNLVGWWPFEGDFLDISGNENHGRPINDANIVAINDRPYAAETGALHLNGRDECVYVPYRPGLDIRNAVTVALWAQGGAGTDRFVSRGGWNNVSYTFRLHSDGSRHIQWRGTSAGNFLNSTNPFPASEWAHVAVSFDVNAPDNNQKIYLNGVLDAENRSTTPLTSSLYYLALGGRDGASHMWAGMLDDVRIYNRALAASEVQVVMTGDPNLARNPVPLSGSTPDEAHATPLSWTVGANAAEHDVYFGADAGAVQNATPAEPLGVYMGRRSDAGFTPADPLQWGRTYYWRIDEVNDAHPASPWKGRVWNFTVADFLAVDDFEGYTDEEGNRIYQTWLDGYTDHSSGSTVGHIDPPFAERTIIHGGRQSMPLDCNNIAAPFYSETSREFSPEQDWTGHNLSELVLWLRGNPAAFLETADGAIAMSAWGADIYGTADQCRFACKPLTGNGTIIARVESIGDSDPWAKGGVMIRESLDADARFAIVFASPANGVRFQARPITGVGATSDTPVATPEQIALQTPVWVKLERSGSTFNGYYSTDGVTWIAMSWNPQSINMVAPTVYIGLAVTSHNVNAPTTASFSGVTMTGGDFAGAWQVAEIGVDHPANSPQPVYVTVEDGAGKKATVVHPDSAATLAATWTEWKIPLTGFSSVNLAGIKKMSIGTGDRSNPQPDGAASLYIDDIQVRLGSP